MAMMGRRPLSVRVSTGDSQGNRAEIAVVDLSEMIDNMAQNKPFSSPVSFDLRNKAAPVEMRLQFGTASNTSCLISGFPRSLLPNSWIRVRTRSGLESSNHSPLNGSPLQDRTVDWEPPEKQDDKHPINIRRYTDPSRKLGHTVGESKITESRFRSRLTRRPRQALVEISEVGTDRMNPIRKTQVQQQALELGLDPGDSLQMEWSRFYLALGQGDKELAEQILANLRTDINLQDQRGRTLLHIAALVGDEAAANLLRKHGAKSTGDRDGWLPIDTARREGFSQLIEPLMLTMPPSLLKTAWRLNCRHPEPTKWVDASDPSKVVILEQGLVAFFADANASGPAMRLIGTRWSVISDHPIPPNVEEYYFELDILGACSDR